MYKGSRKLSLSELFDILQKEYVCCILRSIVFVNSEHVQYWKTVAEFKKDKIVDISKKINSTTIFNDEIQMKYVQQQIYSGFGKPHFIYKNDDDKRNQSKWDIMNFFSKGAEVNVKLPNDSFDTKIIDVYLEEEKILVSNAGKNHKIHFNNVSRKIW